MSGVFYCVDASETIAALCYGRWKSIPHFCFAAAAVRQSCSWGVHRRRGPRRRGVVCSGAILARMPSPCQPPLSHAATPKPTAALQPPYRRPAPAAPASPTLPPAPTSHSAVRLVLERAGLLSIHDQKDADLELMWQNLATETRAKRFAEAAQIKAARRDRGRVRAPPARPAASAAAPGGLGGLGLVWEGCASARRRRAPARARRCGCAGCVHAAGREQWGNSLDAC